MKTAIIIMGTVSAMVGSVYTSLLAAPGDLVPQSVLIIMGAISAAMSLGVVTLARLSNPNLTGLDDEVVGSGINPPVA